MESIWASGGRESTCSHRRQTVEFSSIHGLATVATGSLHLPRRGLWPAVLEKVAAGDSSRRWSIEYPTNRRLESPPTVPTRSPILANRRTATMQTTLFALLLAAVASDPLADEGDCLTTATAERSTLQCEACASTGGSCYFHHGGITDYRCHATRFVPSGCRDPRQGCFPCGTCDPVTYQYYYRPVFNYRHQFDMPWHSSSSKRRKCCLTDPATFAQ